MALCVAREPLNNFFIILPHFIILCYNEVFSLKFTFLNTWRRFMDGGSSSYPIRILILKTSLQNFIS